MDEPHLPDEMEPSPYLRLPWPLVAGGLLAVLGLALAAGLLANRALREQLTLPTPTPPAAVALATAPPNSPNVAVTAVPTRAPSSTAVQPTVAPTATTRPLVATPVPTAVTAQAATADSTPTPTVEPQLADEVGRAYVKFWRVQSQALLELDTSHLSDVMDGDYLASVEKRIDELRDEGRAIKAEVRLNYSVVQAGADSASIVDQFEDNSVYVAIGTDQALSEPTADHLAVLYTLRKVSGAWKVVDSVRSE